MAILRCTVQLIIASKKLIIDMLYSLKKHSIANAFLAPSAFKNYNNS